MKSLRSLLALAGTLVICAASWAQTAYPSKPIRMIVPFPPGGGSDTVARAVAGRLSESWRVPVLVDNKPGGNTLIAAEAAAKAPADGYTLFVAIDSTLAMNQSLYAKLPYDPIQSFAPVTLAVSMPMVLAVNPQVSAHNVKELLALAKQQDGKLAYAHGALPAQVAGEVFKVNVATSMLAVPYKGGAPAMTDVVGGTVPIIFDALGPAMPFIKSGKVRALAVTSAKRSSLLPDVPTVAELGYKGFDVSTWYGLLVPAGTPARYVTTLNAEVNKLLADPEVRAAIKAQGAEPEAMTTASFAALIKTDYAKWKGIVEASGVRVD